MSMANSEWLQPLKRNVTPFPATITALVAARQGWDFMATSFIYDGISKGPVLCPSATVEGDIYL